MKRIRPLLSRCSGTLLTAALLFVTSSPTRAQQWIGAISEEDAHIPAGRHWTGGAEHTPEAIAAWDAADPLSRRSIMLRKEFYQLRRVTKAQVAAAKKAGT